MYLSPFPPLPLQSIHSNMKECGGVSKNVEVVTVQNVSAFHGLVMYMLQLIL